MTRIAVVGAGVVGAAVARALTRGGADVTVYEQGRPGGGTTATTFAWVNSHAKEPESYHALNLAGVRAHEAYQRDSRAAVPWFHRTGNLLWGDTDAEREVLAERMARLRGRDYPVEELTPDEARARVPDLRLDAGVPVVWSCPLEGHVMPAMLLGSLLGEALDGGARLVRRRVTALRPDDDGVVVETDGGTPQRHDRVVSCAGRWSTDLLSRLGTGLPLVRTDDGPGADLGYLARTAPLTSRLDRILTGPRVNVRPDGNGRLVVQCLDLDADAALSADAPDPGGVVAKTLVTRLAEVLRGADDAPLEELVVGRRVLPTDGLTVCGFLDPAERVYAIATHSGITLSIALGDWAREELLEGRTVAELADFRPGRPSLLDGSRAPSRQRIPGEQ